MAGNPAKPRSKADPVGQTRRVRAARGAWRRHIRPIRRWVLDTLAAIPVQQITSNTRRLVVNRYVYQVDPVQLDAFIAELLTRLSAPVVAQEVFAQVRAAYEQGTGDEVANLLTIADGKYERTALSVIQSEPWQRRVALIQGRVFEEMAAFEGDTANDLARVLRTGVEDGRGPLDIARDIRGRFDVSQSRANRIARTEVTGAYRRARWDEDEDAQQRFDFRTGLLWFSSRSDTSREWHVARHGHVYTQQQVRDFYAEGANGINCECSQASVLLGKDGQPVNPAFVAEVRAQASA